MKRKLALWGLLGVVVAGLWVVISLAIPLWQAPTISALARFSCPMVAVGSVFHFGVKWYWAAASNFEFMPSWGLSLSTPAAASDLIRSQWRINER